MDKIKLLKSQTEFLLLKDKLLKQLKDDTLKTVTLIAREQGIPRAELNQYELDEEAEYFEKKKEG